MAKLDTTLRKATKDDAPALARLIDMAGEGIPTWLWSRSAGPGETALEVGERRAAREDGGFSYRNSHVLEVEGQVAGTLLGYCQPDPYDTGDLAELPDVARPLVELEALAPGSWYINAIAVFNLFQRRGFGSQLLGLAESLAREEGANSLSLIVAEENEGARHLYEGLGYRTQARRPIASFPGFAHGGDWILMVKSVDR